MLTCDWCDGGHASLTLIRYFLDSVGLCTDRLCKCCTDNAVRQFSVHDMKIVCTVHDARLVRPETA